MLHPDPNTPPFEKWLAGELSPEEAKGVEQYIEEHTLEMSFESDNFAADLLPGFTVESDPAVSEMISRLKSGLACEPTAPNQDSWKLILTKSDRPELLGTLGDYEVTEVLAVGGMAIVLKGYDPELKRYAALKVLSPGMAENNTARERFLREARAAARLEHENVLPVYGVYDTSVPWYAMRYVAGETLQDRIDRKEEFFVNDLTRIALQILGAIEAAHKEGVIHRDIKPANILLDEDGDRLWVCDFGIARCSDDPSLTYPGTIAGTPRFMSPEQAEGHEVGSRSDYFSFGAVLFLCATGEYPVGGATTAAVLSGLKEERFLETTEKVLRSGPVWLSRLILSLLHPDPEKRMTSPDLIREALQRREFHILTNRERNRRRLLQTSAWTGVFLAGCYMAMHSTIVTREINRGLSVIHGSQFSIAGQIGVYSDLAKTVAASTGGDVVLLPAGEPIPMNHIVVPAGHALTFASRYAGQRAVVTTTSEDGPGITIRSNLTVDGVDFRIPPKPPGSGIMVFEDASGHLRNCRFYMDGTAGGAFPDTGSTAVEIRDGSSVRIESCHFEGSGTNAVTLSGGPGSLEIHDSTLESHNAIHLIPEKSAGNAWRINVRDTAVKAECFIRSSTPEAPFAEVLSRNCTFDIGLAFCWIQAPETGRVWERFRLDTVDPVSTHGEFSVWLGERAQKESGLAVLDPELFSKKHPGPGHIRNSASGREFPDIATALAERGPGEELQVSGTVIVPEEVVIDNTDEFLLSGVPGTKATIVAGDATQHAIFLLGSAKISGIHFTRHEPLPESHPVLGLLAPGGVCEVKNCSFDSFSRAEGNPDTGVGLSITNTSSATVQNCRFRCGRGLFAVFLPGKESRGRIRLSGCFFSGGTALQYATWVPDVSYTIAADRCLFLTSRFLSITPISPQSKIHLEIFHSALDVSDAYLKMEEPYRGEIESSFRLSGTGNDYRPDLKIFDSDQKTGDLAGFLRSLTSATEFSGTGRPVIERSELPSPLTVEDAMRAIDPGEFPVFANVLQTLIDREKKF